MRTRLRKCSLFLALLLSAGVIGNIAWASRPSQEQHEQGYSKNKNYQLGIRDGQDDHKQNRDHYKKRHFKKDDDQKAYEMGYQQGHEGDHTEHR